MTSGVRAWLLPVKTRICQDRSKYAPVRTKLVLSAIDEEKKLFSMTALNRPCIARVNPVRAKTRVPPTAAVQTYGHPSAESVAVHGRLLCWLHVYVTVVSLLCSVCTFALFLHVYLLSNFLSVFSPSVRFCFFRSWEGNEYPLSFCRLIENPSILAL